MISMILAFLSSLPALINGVEGFQKNYYDKQVRMMTIRVGGDVELAKALVAGVVAGDQTRVQFLATVATSPFLMALLGSFAFPVAAYAAKVIIWDTMLGWGTTPAIHGDVATYMNIVVTGVFGTGGVMAVGTLIDKWRK